MISGSGCRPVFQYKFRPLMKDNRKADGGFSVILYENAILSFSTYSVDGGFIDELCFSLPIRSTMQCFYSLLRNAGSWLGATPCDLKGSGPAPYASSFAFDGYDPIRIWNINQLLCEPTGSESGFFARHLYVLFEDVANLFAESGVHLLVDGFTWNTDKIHPFRKNQMLTSNRQHVI